MWRSRFGVTRGLARSAECSHGWRPKVSRLCTAIADSAGRHSVGSSGTSISAATRSDIRSSSSSRLSK